MLALSCKDVTKSFGAFQALKGVSLTVERGECFGLLGPNGAGKSTLISMIYGAASRTSGSVEVFGLDPQSQGRKVRRELGVVTQDNNLDSSMTVIENMQMFSRYVGLSEAERSPRIKELLDFMQLSHKSDEVIESLSGGMQRRLVFVRALLHKPKLVILDEPTTGLDPAVRQMLWDKVTEMKSQGITVLLTTHYMDEAERLCDRLVIMDQGLIKAQGAPAELIAEKCPKYFAGLSTTAAKAFENKTYDGITITRDQSHFLIGAQDLNVLTDFLTRHQTTPLFIRPSNLEDVFLNITGRELADND